MAFIQTDHHSVDQAGYKVVTPAARCELKAASTTLTDENKRPLRQGKLRKRSRLLIRHHAAIAPQTVWVGGDGTSNQGYPLAVDDLIDLPVSPDVLVFIKRGPAMADSDIRTLELG